MSTVSITLPKEMAEAFLVYLKLRQIADINTGADGNHKYISCTMSAEQVDKANAFLDTLWTIKYTEKENYYV